MRLVYLIGEPGVGKSTLMEAATRGRRTILSGGQPFAFHYLDDSTERMLLGRYDPSAAPFFGTDRLSMSVQPRVLRHCLVFQPELVLGEGDRLGNAKFFQGMQELGYDVQCVEITSAHTAERRAERERRTGDEQNATWIRGRITKINTLRSQDWVTHTIVNDDMSTALHELRNVIT